MLLMGKLSSVALLAGMAASEVPPWSEKAYVAHEASEGWHRKADPSSEAREVVSAVHAMIALQLRAARMAAVHGSGGVQRFARSLAAEQERLDARVRRTAQRAGVELEGPDVAAQTWRTRDCAMRRLEDARGPAFDTAYLDWVAAEQRRAVQELEEEAQEPEQSAAVRALLADALPELRREIERAADLRAAARPGGAREAGRRPQHAVGAARHRAAAGSAASHSRTR